MLFFQYCDSAVQTRLIVIDGPIVPLIAPILLTLAYIFVVDSVLAPFNNLASDYNPKTFIFTAIIPITRPATVIPGAIAPVSNPDLSH
jgi:hypothetical protein